MILLYSLCNETCFPNRDLVFADDPILGNGSNGFNIVCKKIRIGNNLPERQRVHQE
jgi:hypothetical protein